MKLLAFLFILLPLQVFAATVELTWEAPTDRTDGTPLSADEIKHYAVSYGENSSNAAPTNVTVVGESYSVELSPGNYFFCVATVDTGDRRSDNRCSSRIIDPPPTANPSIITEIIIRVLDNGGVEIN